MRDKLFRSILMARQRVYEYGEPTPLEEFSWNDIDIYIKREDLSYIHAYKWRGACNRMALLTPEERAQGVICASAGNHAQGVAWAASRLGVSAKIYMPQVTPRMKRLAVERIGGTHVQVVIHGESFDVASAEARRVGELEGRVFVHPYDDIDTMGGQGTMADEVVMSGKGPFDAVFLQIGGGGMAAAVACWLRNFYPNIRIYGVEGVNQASMAAAVRAGRPVDLDYVDVFSDGTAVRRAGTLTHPLCAELIDEFITVTNEEICAAIQLLWEQRRCLPEPAGAMGVAGMLKLREELRGKRVLCIVCGANMDFGQLGYISRHAGIGAATRQYFRFEISEAKGTFLDLIDLIRAGLNIIEFQYGKTNADKAWPVIGVEGSPAELHLMAQRAGDIGIPCEKVTSEEDVEFRMIHYNSDLFKLPFFIKLEFPERAGALREFLVGIRDIASICYFNYVYSGERVGRALLGFEFDSAEDRTEFQRRLESSGRAWHELPAQVMRRIV
ncbi:pyridoxal-phosphate dependent enzyme [bacterium]|nr:pyridoxal-phosphate dependent enzyme [bacterium]